MAAIDNQKHVAVQPLLVICVGNPSRGDDAIGPLVAEQLLNPTQRPLHYDVIETFQLQPELVEDMHDRQLVIVIDAQTNTNETFTLRTVSPAPEFGWCSHAVSPEQLLTLYRTAYGTPVFKLITLGIRAGQFELGAPLSVDVMPSIRHVTLAIQGLDLEMTHRSPSSMDVLAVLQTHLASEGQPSHA